MSIASSLNLCPKVIGIGHPANRSCVLQVAWRRRIEKIKVRLQRIEKIEVLLQRIEKIKVLLQRIKKIEVSLQKKEEYRSVVAKDQVIVCCRR